MTYFVGKGRRASQVYPTRMRRLETIHFNIGNAGAPALAPVPGTPDVDALSFFGQLNIATPRTIRFIHQHLVKGGAGDLNIDVFRRRSAVMTLLTQLNANNPTDFFTLAGVIADPLLLPGDYLFAQVTVATAVTGGGADGLTVDIHFL